MTPRIAIVGAGAIGSVVGGLLTRAGVDVTLVDQWADHVDAMQRDGLRLSIEGHDEITVPVQALQIHELQSVSEPLQHPSPQAAPQSAFQLQLVSPGSQRPLGHPAGQSEGQLTPFSEPVQQPSPHRAPQAPGQEPAQSVSPPVQQPSPQLGAQSAGQLQLVSPAS
ncbi:MAG: FAD-dependent monooxygenase, partial [Chloroflexi bacterium]|nr:FAD-dependent monooxygenase [Chloroflexota bacterium]